MLLPYLTLLDLRLPYHTLPYFTLPFPLPFGIKVYFPQLVFDFFYPWKWQIIPIFSYYHICQKTLSVCCQFCYFISYLWNILSTILIISINFLCWWFRRSVLFLLGKEEINQAYKTKPGYLIYILGKSS